jgi:hypothetical protein
VLYTNDVSVENERDEIVTLTPGFKHHATFPRGLATTGPAGKAVIADTAALSENQSSTTQPRSDGCLRPADPSSDFRAQSGTTVVTATTATNAWFSSDQTKAARCLVGIDRMPTTADTPQRHRRIQPTIAQRLADNAVSGIGACVGASRPRNRQSATELCMEE